MNIFQVIRQTTSRTEPFHSRYLACALQESANSERSLFEAVWKRVAPSEWEVPEHPKITAEEQLETGAIDIVILSNDQRNRIVGIEVKTVEASTETGQLQKYLAGLKEKYSGKDIAMAYLTPFNRERVEQMSEGAADVSLPTIKEFKGVLSDLQTCVPRELARHGRHRLGRQCAVAAASGVCAGTHGNLA